MLRLNKCELPAIVLMPFFNDSVLVQKKVSPEKIIEVVFEHYGTEYNAISNKLRKPEYVKSRQVSAYLMLKHTPLTQKEIGAKFGDQDHSTIIYSRDTIQGFLDVERRTTKKPITDDINKIKRLLGLRN